MAEIIVPITLFCAKLFMKFGGDFLDINYDAHAFLMIERNVADDIEDALIFHRKLMRHVGKEALLKKRAMAAIVKTREALKQFHRRIERAHSKNRLKFILKNHRAARAFLRPLEMAQSSLSRRVDWMRSALETLASSAGEEGELASSMAPGVEHDEVEINDPLTMDEGTGNDF